ncbi:MAG: PTS sugar transporter subunit IIA [Eubacteriaceae bacterium]
MFSLFKKKEKTKTDQGTELKAYITGKSIAIEALGDGVFSEKVLGDGIAIIPEDTLVVAPINGKVAMIMEDSKHAIAIETDQGTQWLIHIGLDTVNMKGEGFKVLTSVGSQVETGDPLIRFDSEKIKAAGYPTTVIMVMAEKGGLGDYQLNVDQAVVAGETVIGKLF